MNRTFTEEQWQELLKNLFNRFPSFQQNGSSAYKPGLDRVLFFDQMNGHPHRRFKSVHIAGTNGKGSVSNMLASVLSACGYKVGLYTSPHILDFRERMRIREGEVISCISREEVRDFIEKWQETFEHLDLSFFEITTMMAFSWFAEQKVDVAVIETGLGGRLDATNIITPELSVITNIGLDHCDLLGSSLGEIAFEKAGIIKPLVPVVVGESHLETDEVFERKTLYTNLSEAEFMGDRKGIMDLLVFADKVQPGLWDQAPEILQEMDLQGIYQQKNLRTALAAVDVLCSRGLVPATLDGQCLKEALVHTAARMDFHGRWEKLSDLPYVLCDIGHNAHGMKYNFAQLQSMLDSGEYSSLILVYGSVNDKDVKAVLKLMPAAACHIFTQADNHRALPAEELEKTYVEVAGGAEQAGDCRRCTKVSDAVALALEVAGQESAGKRPLIYIGGSTYIVSEAVPLFKK